MFWLALTRKDDEEVEIFGAADRVHIEAGRRRNERRRDLSKGGNLSADVLHLWTALRLQVDFDLNGVGQLQTSIRHRPV
jgi:hypothetical protein